MSGQQKAAFEETMLSLTSRSLSKWYDRIAPVDGGQDNLSEMMAEYAERAEQCFTEIYQETVEERANIYHATERAVRKAVSLAKQLDANAATIDIQDQLSLLWDKISVIKALKDRESHLCKSLGRPPRVADKDDRHLAQFIDDFQLYLSKLELKLLEREDKFRDLKPRIRNLAKSLHFKPSFDFERLIVSDSDSAFVFSDDNMEHLEKMYKSLKADDAKIAEELPLIREQLDDLWLILEEDQAEWELFLETNEGNHYDALENYRKELNRCLELKKANIEMIVKKKRQELISMWDTCRVGEHERSTFSHLDSTAYCDDLLDLFRAEIRKWQNYFEKNRAIFKLLGDWHELRSTMVKLEERATQTDRYKNRGGKLLEEEKERNRVHKQMPKIEGKFKSHAQAYYRANKKQFLVWGQPLEDFISAEIHNYREQQRQRQRTDARKGERERTPGKCGGGLSRAPSLQNLGGAPKRALAAAPGHCPLKRAKVAETAPPKIRVNDKTVMRYSIDKLRRMRDIRKSMEEQQVQLSPS